MLTEEDRRREAELALDEQRRQEVDRDRLELLEREDRRRRQRTAGRPYYEEYQIGRGRVRYFHPSAPSRFRRFRALSDLLLVGAYLVVFIALVGMGLTVYLWVEGALSTVAHLLIALALWLVGGLTLFLLMKFCGELAFLLSDVGDQQNDIVQLLRDLRENTEPPAADEDEAPPPAAT